jgi:hypothetical protein
MPRGKVSDLKAIFSGIRRKTDSPSRLFQRPMTLFYKIRQKIGTQSEGNNFTLPPLMNIQNFNPQSTIFAIRLLRSRFP